MKDQLHHQLIKIFLSLESLSLEDQSARPVTAEALDLQTAATGEWINLGLASNLDFTQINPGEALAFHFHLGAAPAGDLEIQAIFEVIVDPGLYPGPEFGVYLPIVAR